MSDDTRIAPDTPCICCPQQVRALYAVAFNLLNLVDHRRVDPERFTRKFPERIDELRQAVTALTPFIEQHFADDVHARGEALATARAPMPPARAERQPEQS